MCKIQSANSSQRTMLYLLVVVLAAQSLAADLGGKSACTGANAKVCDNCHARNSAVCNEGKANNFGDISKQDCSTKCYYWYPYFEDEFAGTQLSSWWDRTTQPSCAINEEDQAYTDSVDNSFVGNGKLTIQVLKDKEVNGKSYYSSARLSSKGNVDFKYGRVDVRAKLARGLGTWPAIWMLPSETKEYGNWPNSGEIDIMEMVGFQLDKVHGTVHTGNYNHLKKTQKGAVKTIKDSSSTWHVYSMRWTASAITYLIDGVAYFKYKKQNGFMNWPFDKPQHIILNVALGGSWGGYIDKGMFTAASSKPGPRMEIDFVRVFKEVAKDKVPTGGGCPDPGAKNYNKAAQYNDGSCVYSFTAAPMSQTHNKIKNNELGCAASQSCNFGCTSKHHPVYFALIMTANDWNTVPSAFRNPGNPTITLAGDWNADKDGVWAADLTLKKVSEGKTGGGVRYYEYRLDTNAKAIGYGVHKYALFVGTTSNRWGYNLMKRDEAHKFTLRQSAGCGPQQGVTMNSCGGTSFDASQSKLVCRKADIVKQNGCYRNYGGIGTKGRPSWAKNTPTGTGPTTTPAGKSSNACDDAAKRACSAANKQDCSGDSKTCGGCKSGYKASGDKCVAVDGNLSGNMCT